MYFTNYYSLGEGVVENVVIMVTHRYKLLWSVFLVDMANIKLLGGI